MLIIGSSIFLWLLALLTVVRLTRIILEKHGSENKRISWFILATILLAACLLFRPHEDIFGGEDPWTYINSGITYGRNLGFFHVDPLLSQVPVEDRPLFYYGHAGFGTTKDACLWVRDEEKAIIGPNFQPAYPLLIGAVSRAAGPMAALYVIPIFTLFAALAIGALALQCLPHRWAGASACLLYIMNPLVLWHGRCARPEIIASFLFFGGSALLLYAWNAKPFTRFPDMALGTLCIGFAPLFHITALLIVLPAIFVLVLLIMHGRDDFLPTPVLLLIPAFAFLYQSVYVTDYYRLARFLTLPLRVPLFAVAALVFFYILPAGICLAVKRIRDSHKPRVEEKTLSIAAASALAIVTIAFFLVSYTTRDATGSLPILDRPIHHYLYLTDLKAIRNMLSRPMAILALAGWATWLTGPAKFRSVRAVMALSVFPGIMLAGKINDFMMTRYLLVTIIPIMALGMTALVTLLPDRRRFSVLAAALALLLGAAGLRNRTHLLTLTEHKGFADFLRPFAQTITNADGILLCEYSRIAAPFEHFFGIPTLGLDNEHKLDYSRQEAAWKNIMKNDPDRPAFFITPFQKPISDSFDFTPIFSSVFEDRSLQQAYNMLPTRIRSGSIPLALYEMKLKTAGPPASGEPFVVLMNSGNMGVRGFANLRIRPRKTEGMEWPRETPLSIDASAYEDDTRELILMLLFDEPNPSAPRIINKAGREAANENSSRFFHMADEWWIFQIRLEDGENPISLSAATPAFLADALLITAEDVISLLPRIKEDQPVSGKMMKPFRARWALSESKALVPMPLGGRGTVLLFLSAPDISDGDPARLTISDKSSAGPLTRKIETNKWQWQAWPLNAEVLDENYLWLNLHIQPAWDSGLRGFPPNLGALVGYIVMLPALQPG